MLGWRAYMTTTDQELAVIENRLNALEHEKRILLERKQRLLDNKNSEAQPTTAFTETLSPTQKVNLFTSLFKGREDIFALRWENKQGRNGYTVACANEWKSGICNKPRIKCSDCTHRFFRPLIGAELFDHLAGKHTVGLYPLLPDNNCWLLAVDFDKSDWQEAITAFHHACKSWSIDCLVERSRSGNGAHLWVFFNELTPAADARKLGFALLDKAMEQHAGLSFDSYDRLFPNQDTMPDGGFGNLIALPLQLLPRKYGNSVFVDEHFQPYQNQWQALASITKLERKQVYDLLGKIEEKNTDSLELKPWEKNLPVSISSINGCPTSLTVVLANKIYLPVDKLPQALIARLKRLASFSNPVFFKTQALRFSTNGIPRFICLAHIEQGYLALPRGCMDDMIELLDQQSIQVEFDDKRQSGTRLKKSHLKVNSDPIKNQPLKPLENMMLVYFTLQQLSGKRL